MPAIAFFLVISVSQVCHCAVIATPRLNGTDGRAAEADLAQNEIRMLPRYGFALKSPPTLSPLYANSVFLLGHEMGHLRLQTESEHLANRYGRDHYSGIARKLGVKRVRKLRALCDWCEP